MWIWKVNRLRSVDLDNLCPDEILELSFDDEDLSAKHIRMHNTKSNLYTSQTGPSVATIESSASLDFSERVSSSQTYLINARCKNNMEYALRISDSVEILGTQKLKGGMALPQGVFREPENSVRSFPFNLKLTEYPFIREFIDK
jgi:hypothetical protein